MKQAAKVDRAALESLCRMLRRMATDESNIPKELSRDDPYRFMSRGASMAYGICCEELTKILKDAA